MQFICKFFSWFHRRHYRHGRLASIKTRPISVATETQSNSSSSSDTQAFLTSSTHTESPPTSNTDSTPIPITSSTQFPNTRYNCRRCRLVGISYRKLLDRYNTIRQVNRDYKKELNKNSRK